MLPARTIILLCCLFSHASAQLGNLFVTNYPPVTYSSYDYPASPVNLFMVEDSRGVLYVSNLDLIMEFDGNHWNKVLHCDSALPALLTANGHGKVFAANYFNPELGYLDADDNGHVRYHSLQHKVPVKNFVSRKIFCLGDDAYFISADAMIKWETDHFKVIQLPSTIIKTFLINGDPLFLATDNSLFRIKDDKLIQEYKASLPKGIQVTLIIAASTGQRGLDQSIAFTKSGKVLKWKSGHWNELHASLTPILHNLYQSGGRITSGILLHNETIALSTSNMGIIICDSMGNLIRQINRTNSSIIDEQVWSVYEDHSGGLWATSSTGMARIDYPASLTYLDNSNLLGGSRVNSLLKMNDDLYACTQIGLYKADLRNEHIVFSRVGPQAEAWEVIVAANTLLLASDNGIFEIKENQARQIFDNGTFTLVASRNFNDIVYAGTQYGLGLLKFENNSWKLMGMVDSIRDRVSTIVETVDKRVWVAYEKVSRADFSRGISLQPHVDHLNERQGFSIDPHGWWEVYGVKEKTYFGSWLGLFHFNEQIGKLEADTTFGKTFAQGRECAELTADREGNIWLTSEFVTGKVTHQNNMVSWDTTAFMRLPRANGVRDIMIDEKERVWLGTDLGIYIYDPSAKNIVAPLNALIRKFKINRDSTIFFGAVTDRAGNMTRTQPEDLQYIIPYKQRNVSFSFTANDYTAPDRMQYATVLKGPEEIISGWSNETQKDYSNLREGHYTFYVQAKNIEGKISAPVTFSFVIEPPWYRTWWAYLMYTVLAVLFVLLILWLNQKRLILAKRNLEKTVRDRTTELEEKTRQLENTMQELKNTESQLIHSEKMASLGQLTAGIAHEINNPINFVAGNVGPLQRDIHELLEMIYKYNRVIEEKNLGSEFEDIDHPNNKKQFEITIDEVNKLLKGIQEGSNRTAEIVRGLRNFSRIDEAETVKANVNDSIDSTLTLLHNKYKNRIDVVKDYDPMLPEIECYPGPLNQVFMNILSNAVDAIEEEGKIFISTSTLGDNVKIVIQDTGTGINKEVLSKIFDPFFTTKSIGEGTGLGLAISYGIIEKHNGKISVKSEGGKGAAFTIILPVKQPK